MKPPTKETYELFQLAYDHFNRELFDGELPDCLITMQRKANTAGYFAANQFSNRRGQNTDEIALNPRHLLDKDDEDACSTLAHEQVHLWQQHFGSPGRGRYHNREWAAKMREIGLQPSTTGKPGGKDTGDRMSHYVVKNGRFQKSFRKLRAKGFRIKWADRERHKNEPVTTRTKYSCNGCGLNLWGKPGARVRCEDCDRKMRAAS